MTWHDAIGADELADGESKIIEIDGRSIGVFRVDKAYRAVLNFCPHAGAPVCAGRVTGRVTTDAQGRPGLDTTPTLRCPWHHWEFDLATGHAVAPGVRERLKVYDTRIADQRVQLRLP